MCGGHLVAVGRAAGVGGEHAGGDPLGGGLVDHGPRRGGDGDGDVLLQGAVAGGVIRDSVLPAAPHDAAPGAAEGAHRAGVVVAAGDRAGVVVRGPGVPVAGAVGERAERVAQALVARPAEARDLALTGFDRDGGLAGVAGERVAGRVARAAVADLGQQLAAVTTLSGSLNSERKISPSGCARSGGGDLALELA